MQATPGPNVTALDACQDSAGLPAPGSIEPVDNSAGYANLFATLAASSGCASSACACSTALVAHHSQCLVVPPSQACAPVSVASTSTGMVPKPEAARFMGHEDRWLNANELKAALGTPPHYLERPSLLNALAFRCGDKNCLKKQCSLHLDEINVYNLRQKWHAELACNGYTESSMSVPVMATLLAHFDKDSAKFSNIEVQVVDRRGRPKSVELCIGTWAVIVPNLGWNTFTKLRAEVPKQPANALHYQAAAPGLLLPARKLLQTELKSVADSKNDEKFRLVVAYIRELVQTLEANPTPGAQRQIEYIAPRQTWDTRVSDLQNHFAAKGVAITVSRETLQRAWRSIAALVDKSMKSHAKCDHCSFLASQLAQLIGKPGEDYVKLREQIRAALRAHRVFCATERAELDDAGYRSILYPQLQATFIADGATQRNFMLPRLRKRLPKELAHRNLFASKLYGVFVYGYGMNCYIVHESVGGGANLSCTTIYLTLLDMVMSGRPLPEELHLQLDNTTSENKCMMMWQFAGWLLHKFRSIKRVRIFFLVKGHTHVIIDQAFGAITKYIRSRSVHTMNELLDAVKTVLNRSRKYLGRRILRLHHLYDWPAFFHKTDTNLEGFATSAFNPDGYHDIVVTLNSDEHPVINFKRFASTPDWVSADGFRIFKEGGVEGLQDKPPIAELKGEDAWDRSDFGHTYRMYEPYFGLSEGEITSIRRQWMETMDNTASSVSSLKRENIIEFEQLLEHVNVPNVVRGLPSLTLAATVDVSNPPVCTISGAHRSKGQVAKEVEQWLISQRGELPIATTPLSSVPLYATDYLLINQEGHDLPQLVKISRRIQGHLPAMSPAVEVKCTKYSRESSSDSNALCGPFTRTAGEVLIVARAEILVYNVCFLKQKAKSKEGKYLSVDTLECLEDALPRVFVGFSKPDRYNPDLPKQVGANRTMRRRPQDGADDESDSDEPEEDDGEDDPLSDEDAEQAEGGSSDDPLPNADEVDFRLTGERKKHEFIWVDLEDDPKTKHLTPPIGLAVCDADEEQGKVLIKWYGPYSWQGKTLSHLNSRFGKWWSGDTWDQDTIEVSTIVPVRVALSYHKADIARVTPEAIDALLKWAETTKKPRKQPTEQGKGRKSKRKQRS